MGALVAAGAGGRRRAGGGGRSLARCRPGAIFPRASAGPSSTTSARWRS